jgi:hypothetical protein
MLTRLSAALSLAFVCASCASIGPADAVRDSDSAILRAQQICGWVKASSPAERWHSAFRDGKWHVWVTSAYGDSEEPNWGYRGSAFKDVWISPRDGSSEGCADVLG